MEIRDLNYFCLTAELEHVTKAAEKLGVAQPYLTKIIGQLEAEVGVPLFDKVGRQIKLNHCGEVFYEQAKKVLAAMDNLHTEMDNLLDRPSRTITILSNTEAYTTGMIVEFNANKSNYGLSIFYASQKDMISALKSGEADFALTCPPISERETEGIKTDIAFYDVGRILLPPSHPLLKMKVIRFEWLENDKLVTSPKDSAIRLTVEPLYKLYGMPMDIVCESNNLSLVTQAVLAGMGYAFIPSIYLLEHPELCRYTVEVLAPQEQRQSYFGLSYSKLSEDNPNVRHFKSFALGYFRSLQQKVNFTPTSKLTEVYGEIPLHPTGFTDT